MTGHQKSWRYEKGVYRQEEDVIGISILYSISTLNFESEYIHIDYDLHIYHNIKTFLIIIYWSCDCRSSDFRSNECRSFKRDPLL